VDIQRAIISKSSELESIEEQLGLLEDSTASDSDKASLNLVLTSINLAQGKDSESE